MTNVEQCCCGVEVRSCDLEKSLDGVDPMTELQSSIPDRVPELLGDICNFDVWRMDQDDVDVALRSHLRTAVSTHRAERHPFGEIHRFGDSAEPLVDQRGVGSSEFSAV